MVRGMPLYGMFRMTRRAARRISHWRAGTSAIASTSAVYDASNLT
jgi:hypothetical protein